MMDCHCHHFTLFSGHPLLTCFGDEVLGEMDALTHQSCS